MYKQKGIKDLARTHSTHHSLAYLESEDNAVYTEIGVANAHFARSHCNFLSGVYIQIKLHGLFLQGNPAEAVRCEVKYITSAHRQR